MNYIGIIYALIASITWGLVYNLDQKILIKSSPLTMFFVGSFINIVILIPLYLTSKENIKDIFSMDKSQFSLLFISQILVIIAGLAILTSIKYLNAPLASIFEISYPFFVVIFYVLFFNGNDLNTNFWIGAILMFIGSLVIMR